MKTTIQHLITGLTIALITTFSTEAATTAIKANTSFPISATVRQVFKANTTVTTDGMGYVTKGILAFDTNLGINYTPVFVLFKGGTEVTFRTLTINNIRPVQAGTIATDTNLNVKFSLNVNDQPWFVRFKAGTSVTFENSMLHYRMPAVRTGTPAVDTNFTINHVPNFVLFKAGSPITLTGTSGIVINGINPIKTGTLARDTYLYINYTQTKLFKAGTRVTFSGIIRNNINPVIP